MKQALLLIIAGCSLFAGGEMKLEQPVWDSYLAAQTALAADNWGEAQKALKALAEKAKDPLKKPAVEAAAAADIKAARLAFRTISELLKEAELPAGSSLAFCPMVEKNRGAHWIQKSGEIRNPYYGASMLKCGEIKKTVAKK